MPLTRVPRPHPRRLTPFAGAVLVAVIIAGCSVGSGTPSAPEDNPVTSTPAPGVVTADSVDLVLPIAPYVMTAEEMAVVDEAVLTLVNRCLLRFGIQGEGGAPRSGPRFGATERRYGLDDADAAATNGYHLASTAVVPSGTGSSPASDELLFGSPTPGASVEGEAVPAGGCVGAAMRTLNGGDAASEPAGGAAGADDDLGAPEVVQQINVDSVNAARSDDRVVAAFADWSACMEDRGFDYADPWAAPADDRFATPGATPEEIAVATADVACKDETGLVARWHAVDVEVQEAMVAEHAAELAAAAQVKDDRVAAAQAVVVGEPDS